MVINCFESASDYQKIGQRMQNTSQRAQDRSQEVVIEPMEGHEQIQQTHPSPLSSR